jgi:hypothetical protein
LPVDAPGDRPADDHRDLLAWALGRRLELRLSPGATAWLLLQGGRSVDDWVRLHQLYAGSILNVEPATAATDQPGVRFSIDVQDQFAEGVHDVLMIDALALPLSPIDGSASGWRPTFPLLNPMQGTNTSVRVHGSLRSYPSHEGQHVGGSRRPLSLWPLKRERSGASRR